MEYRKLGSSGVKVSSLCLGAMTFGEPDATSFMHGVACDEQTAFALMDRALQAGINCIDTANVYGNDGLSERVVGRWLASRKRRNDLVIATKFRFRMSEGPNGAGASRYHIVRAVEESLARLGTDRIDLYQIHQQDFDAPEQETLRALDDLVRAGKVLYLGASNYAAYRLADSLWLSRTEHLERFVTLQAQYSLVARELEREHVPLCREHGLGILPWSPLAAGFLSGKFRKGQPPPRGTRLDKWKERLEQFDTERNWNLLRVIDSLGSELHATPAQLALAWLLHKPQVSSVIIGARTLEQLEDNLQSASLKLSADVMRRLDEASAFPLGYPYDFIQRTQGVW